MRRTAAVLKKLLAPALGLCLFLTILGAKWATFNRYGSPMPDWDQWDAEAMELLVPWFTHDHFLSHLFHPHNEHRILLTKLQNLSLVLLNGQWDSRLEAVANAALHSLLGVAFWWFVRRYTERRWHAVLFTLIAALFALPLAWQNVLGGFHSQQYWLLLLSFIAIVALCFPRTGSLGWCAGCLAALLALGSMGSGFLAAAVIALVLGLRWWLKQITLREATPTLVLVGAIVVFGLATRVDFEQHASLKATGIGDFFWSTVRSLQWPLRHVDIGAIVMWTPFAMVTWHLMRGRASGEGGWLLFALGTWVLVQILATAYARGVGGDYPASRYMDTLQFGALVNAIALVWLEARPQIARRRSLGLLALLWCAGLGFGGYQNLDQAFDWDLPQAKRYYFKAESALHRYLVTHNQDELALVDLPYPSEDELVERLNHPVLNALLPLPIRAPMPLMSAQPEELRHDAAFLPNQLPAWNDVAPLQHGLPFATSALDSAPTWGSYGFTGLANQGEWRSAPLTPSPWARWLKFETAGNVGESGVALELRDARTDSLITTVQPGRVPHDSWRSAYVHAPTVPFVVVARDHDAARWLAFSPPMEMGRLSYWAWQAAKNGRLLLILASTASLLLLALAWWTNRNEPKASAALPPHRA